MRSRAAALAWIALAGASTVARAESVSVRAVGCASVPADQLETAVRREAALDPKLATRVEPLAVDIACADGVHASVRVDAGATPPVAVEIDLSDEPDELRVKLLALAVVELAHLAATAPPPLPPPVVAVVPTPAVDLENAPDPIVGTAAVPRPPIGLTVRAGVRFIVGDVEPLATVGGDLDAHWLKIGLVAALGDGRRREGTPYIVALSLSRTLVCSHGETAVCVVARGEGGFAGAETRVPDTMITHNLYAGYGDLAVGFEVRRQIGGWNWVANLDLGGADGLIIEQELLEHLDGPFAVAAVGASW